MPRVVALIPAVLMLAFGACGDGTPPPLAPSPAAATRTATGLWTVDKVGFGRVVDDALAKLDLDMAAKLSKVPESERAVAKDVGRFAATALASFRDLEMSLDAAADGTFTMSGVDPVGHTGESGSGRWTDLDGVVTFTITLKNGQPFDGSRSPMRLTWGGADTLEMRVPSLDVGIPFRRR